MRWTMFSAFLVAGAVVLGAGQARAQDLTVTSFTAAVNGTTVTFSATVCNAGPSTGATFDLDLYYDRATPPACPTLGDQFATINGLATTACTVRTFTRTATPPGSYTAWARVDSTCAVAEGNEGNNNGSTGYTVSAQPDLQITSFSTSVLGTSVTFSATICNNGATTASNFYLDIYHNRATAPACPTLGDQFATITSLTPGACTTRTFNWTGPPGVYDGWARVDAGCSVTESNEGNNNATSPYTLGNPQPDLVVTVFSTPVVGSTVTFNATVCNNGSAAAGNFYLDIYYDRASPPTCPTLGDDYATISSLAPGACTLRVFTRTATPAGTYTGWARADAGCSVSETNEGNNNASSTYTVGGQPDLTISNFTTIVTGGNVTFNVSVCNVGNLAASNVDLEIYYNLASGPGCTTAHSQQTVIASLAPGACTSRVLTRTGTPAGSYTGWARVDADCAIAESNENNNNDVSAYTVVPDLVIQSFNTTVNGSTVTFDVTACNAGGGTSTSFDLDVYYNRVGAPACPTLGDDFATIAGLAAGACTTRTFTRSNTPVGSYLGWARIDSVCSVTESNENNNNMSSAYTVAVLADLLVQSFTASVTGTTVTFNVNVCNSGGTTASNIDLELYFDRNTAPGCATVHDQQLTITSLAAGACTTRTFTRTATPTGAYTGWVRVDADCAIGESDESNNNASASYTIGAQPDLQVQSFSAVVSGTTVTFSATVCNGGGTTTASFYLDLYYSRATGPTCPTLGDDYTTINGLAAGACVAHVFTRTNTPLGVYTGWARVDSTCNVSETNENNNNASAAYTVAPLVDAGLPSDAGVPPVDTGVPPADTGVPPADTGVPPADTGVPPTDTGLPPADTGPPPEDTGLPPADTGLPPADTGLPPADTGLPPADTGAGQDGATIGDGGVQADAGSTAPPQGGGGCSCRVDDSGASDGASTGLLLLALSVLVGAQRRRRRR